MRIDLRLQRPHLHLGLFLLQALHGQVGFEVFAAVLFAFAG